MGLIPEIDHMDENERLGIETLYIKDESQLYEEFAREYVKQGHTWTEACKLVCDDMRRIDPELYDVEYLKEQVEDAKIGEAYLNSLHVYEEFAREYVKQGHTLTEACKLACNDMMRRDPELYNEEYLQWLIKDAKKELVEDAKIGEGYLNALNVYEGFTHEYVRQGRTWIEACKLACNDMRRIDPELYDEEYLKKLIEDARIG